jgi:hypothetical protein
MACGPQARELECKAPAGCGKVPTPMTAPSEPSALVSSAMQLEEELVRFEQLTHSVCNTTLTSQKSLARASGVLEELADTDTRLGEKLKSLLGAINAARDRHQKKAQELLDAAKGIQARSTELETLLRRFAAVGQEAKRIREEAEIVLTRHKQAEGGNGTQEAVQGLLDQLDNVSTVASELAVAARQAEFNDLERQADGLFQQLRSAANKVRLMAGKSPQS